MHGPPPPSSYPIFNNDGPRAQHFRGLTLRRLDQFESSNYPNITSVLFQHRTDDPQHVQLEVWHSPGREKTPFKEAIRKKFVKAEKGMMLGPSWTNHWFRVTITPPSSWLTSSSTPERIQLEFDPSCEAMIFDTEGCPLQGITGGFGIDRRVEWLVPRDKWKTGLKIYIEVSNNAMFGNGSTETNAPPDMNRYYRLNSADLVVPRMDAWRLLWDFRVIKGLARSLPDRSPLGAKCLEVGNAIMNVFSPSDLSTFSTCRALAAELFGGDEWICEGGEGKVYERDREGVTSWAIGNCHIDTAWLWPFSVTRQKTARSWSTQLDLIARYPEHRFVASQAQQFKWLEQDYPLLFQKVREGVQEGKFIPIGGMWVESDQLLPSGESLARQFLYGQRYFHSRFGQYCKTWWLPDSFGYNSASPQIARLAGLEFFFTQKLSWSQFNEFPNTSFRWQGQDNTQMVVHMCPQNTYTAQASVDDVLNTWRNHKSLQSHPTGLMTFGNGDGGGGPLAPMLENLRRCRAVANNAELGGGEIPKVHMGVGVDEFYADLVRRTEGAEKLPVWVGELYLELHRGTATSHGSIKRHNRKAEVLLHDLEFAATLATVFNAQVRSDKAYAYPKDEIDRLWEDTLLCQFHDVLPGSAIGMVYEDAETIYADVREKGSALLDAALSALLPGSVSLASNLSSSFDLDSSLVAIDTLALGARRELVKVPLAAARALDEAAVQRSADGEAYVLFESSKAGETILEDPVGTEEVVLRANELISRARSVGDGFVLATPKLQVTLTKDGRISSILDKELERELILVGKTAGFVIFQDHPLNWDAWDVDAFHLETRKEVNASSIKVIEDGPLRSSVLATYHYGKSVIKATISLDAAAPSTKADALSLVRFDVQVDWHQRHEFLKWELPLAITPTGDVATFENQFGLCQRPTHRNTTWQRAQFEVCGHRYADLSEFGYGVALVNDCKYGHACENSTLRLSLLRAATIPDAEQDQGQHRFSFAVYLHRGTFAESDVPDVARAFNYPLHIRRLPAKSAKGAKEGPFFLTGARNVILDTIKRGEDDHFGASAKGECETVVLRMYEAYGGAGKVKLVAKLPEGRKVVKAEIVDLLERPVDSLEVLPTDSSPSAHLIDIPRLRAFQILTVRLTLA
ncbi:Glycoside hydrolase, 38 vacuolar alpha mannosidase [Rhodotorula toruloides]